MIFYLNIFEASKAHDLWVNSLLRSILYSFPPDLFNR